MSRALHSKQLAPLSDQSQPRPPHPQRLHQLHHLHLSGQGFQTGTQADPLKVKRTRQSGAVELSLVEIHKKKRHKIKKSLELVTF